MVDNGESNHTRTKSLSRVFKESNEDIISQLPDHLISHILSHLRTKEAVKTSVLSTRWRSVWVWVPVLDLSSSHFPNDFNSLLSFCDRFFDSSRVSRLHKVKIHIDDYKLDSSPLEPWIDSAVERKIQHLDIHRALDTKIPLRLYNCETLVSLKLYQVEVSLELDDVEFVSLPCLKSMHLKYISYWTDASFERLVSCCPVLEELTLFEYACSTVSVFRVISRSLKKLMIKLDEDDQFTCSGFVVDAPLLSFLSIKENLTESFVINYMDSNAKLDISLHVGLHNIDEAISIQGFLSGIVKVRDMTICKGTFTLICGYVKLKKPLPQFAYMSRLYVSLDVFDLEELPTFLKSCPNLKSLTVDCKENFLVMRDYFLNYRISSSSFSECLLLSVEFVDIKTSIYEYAPGLKLVRYFLENSAILKKLTLRLDHYSAKEKLLVKKILEIPRRSVTCQVVVQDARFT